MTSVISRLERLERVCRPSGGVVILTSLSNGAWELIRAGKHQERSVHKTLESAKTFVKPDEHLIIDDL